MKYTSNNGSLLISFLKVFIRAPIFKICFHLISYFLYWPILDFSLGLPAVTCWSRNGAPTLPSYFERNYNFSGFVFSE